jgi:hypothetical protein
MNSDYKCGKPSQQKLAIGVELEPTKILDNLLTLMIMATTVLAKKVRRNPYNRYSLIGLRMFVLHSSIDSSLQLININRSFSGLC